MDVARMPEPGATDGPLRQDLLRIYEQTKSIAIVGASANGHKAAHMIPTYLQSQRYRIIPVNPKGGEILGERVYPSLDEIDALVDVVDVFRPLAEAEAIARQAIVIGADVLWFQPGTHTTEAIQLAAGADLIVVAGRCMGAMHGELGLGSGPSRTVRPSDLRSHNESEQVPNGTRSSHREDLHPLIPLLGDASTPADQYVSYQKKTNDRSLDHD